MSPDAIRYTKAGMVVTYTVDIQMPVKDKLTLPQARAFILGELSKAVTAIERDLRVLEC